MKRMDNPKRTITIHVIRIGSDAADGTIDLRGKKTDIKTILDHIRRLKYYNGSRNLSDNPYKDLGDGMYTVSPTMMKHDMLKYYASKEYSLYNLVTVHK